MSRLVQGGSAIPVYVVNGVFLPISGGTLTGNLNFGGYQIINYTEKVITAEVSTDYEIDASLGSVFVLTLTASVNISFANMIAGRGITVHIIQDDVSSRVPTFVGVTWDADGVPTLSTTANYRDKLVFDSYDGSVIDGQLVGLNYS